MSELKGLRRERRGLHRDGKMQRVKRKNVPITKLMKWIKVSRYSQELVNFVIHQKIR